METFLGCDSQSLNQQFLSLCEDIEIDSMFVFEDKVYIFRVDKYWVFEFNVEKSDQPLGPLIEGDVDISNKWKGIDGKENRFTIRDNKIVAISYEKWTEMEINGDIVKIEDIVPEKTNQETSEVLLFIRLRIKL